jgi:signal transduction histidine kinase
MNLMKGIVARMANVVELLLRLKPEWEQAYREYAADSQDAMMLQISEVTRFIEVLLEDHLTGEQTTLQRLLDDMRASHLGGFEDQISFEKYQQSSLIKAIHTLRAIMINTLQRAYAGDDLLNVHATVELFFSRAVEYLAYSDAMEQLRRALQRQKEVQADLERLDESRSNFVSVAAHGLKTPLTLVEGYSQMLKEQVGENAEETLPLIAGIESGTLRMRELIDDLVDVALIDNKMLSLYYQPMELTEWIENVLRRFKDQIESKKLSVIVDEFTTDQQVLYADKARLDQALVEVIDNAIQYTPSEGEIHISNRRLPGFVELSIADTGVGIDPEDQQRIFERFGKLTTRLAGNEDGVESASSGLGLHLSKGILEAHGGAIWVDSPGFDEQQCPGSVFHLMIPARDEPPDDPSVRLLGRQR